MALPQDRPQDQAADRYQASQAISEKARADYKASKQAQTQQYARQLAQGVAAIQQETGLDAQSARLLYLYRHPPDCLINRLTYQDSQRAELLEEKVVQEKVQRAMDKVTNGGGNVIGFDRRRQNGHQQDGGQDEAPRPKPIEPLPYVNMSTWDTEPVPEQDWTVLNRIPRRQTVLFSGEGAAGKSTVQLHLCAAHVLGRDWLGTMPEQGPAIFVDAEDDVTVMHRRLAAITKHYGVTFAELIKSGLHLISLVGHDAVLATVSRGGKVEPTPRYEQLFQAAGDIKPVMIGIASSANVYAGSEIDRSQVQQFISLLTRLAIVAGGSVSLLSHPSLTGIQNDTGVSGSTQWHNAVRARFYMKGIKPENGEDADNDLREITFKKNNYGPVSESIIVRYTNGLFLPVPGVASLDRAAQEAKADDVFLDLLRRFTKANRTVSDRTGTNYAPAKFAKEDEAKRAGINSKALEASMRRLFKAGKVWNEPIGRPSRPSYRLGIKGESNGPAGQIIALEPDHPCVHCGTREGQVYLIRHPGGVRGEPLHEHCTAEYWGKA